MKKDSIETLSRRAAEVCRTLGLSQITVMMQARDTDPLSFGSVIRVDAEERINPFGESVTGLKKTREAASMLRNWDAAHAAAERMVAMADFNRSPDFVNAFLSVTPDEAVLYVHCGIGGAVHVIEERVLGQEAAVQAA